MNELGKKGEDIASKFLEISGFEVVERNYVCPLGEIDIVAKKDEIRHFVEVKSRANLDYGKPPEVVNIFKQRKVRMLANYYMMVNRHEDDAVCDIVGVVYDPINRKYSVSSIENAF